MNHISWQAYGTILAFATIAYYLFLYLVFFRRKIKMPVSGWQRSVPFDSKTVGTSSDTENIVQQCMDELNAFFEEARRSKKFREEVLYSLKLLFQKYPSLKNSIYQESLTKLAASQAEHLCSVHLSAEEIAKVWLGR